MSRYRVYFANGKSVEVDAVSTDEACRLAVCYVASRVVGTEQV